MKLIRLATNNNATFDCNFDTPIQIKPNSSLALQNCTLERLFDLLEISEGNSEVGSQNTGSLGKSTADIPIGTVVNNAVSQEEFFHILTGELNATLEDLDREEVAQDSYAGGGAEYIVRRNPKSQKTEIIYQYSYLIPPFLRISNETPMDWNTNNIQFEPSIITASNIGDRFSLTAGTTKTTDRTYNATCEGGLGMVRGCGTFSIQIEESTDNTLGGVFPITNNGVGIGLILGKDQLDDEIDDAEVDFEIYYNRPAENYSKIVGLGSARVDTGVAPLKVSGGTTSEHDTIVFEVSLGGVRGVIKQDGVVKQTVINEVFTDAQKKAIAEFGIQPFIYLNDDENFIKVCNARINFSPFVKKGHYTNDNELNSLTDRDLSVPGLTVSQYQGLPFRYNPNHSNELGARRIALENIDFQLEIPRTILVYFGFVENELFTFADIFKVKNGQVRFESKNEISYTFDDFFIVESQTLQLDSYNGVPDERITDQMPLNQKLSMPLKGDRKNILATIPINESLGEVVFETNTPIFIDIRNTSETNIRNLKFRVLDQDFNPIKTSGSTNLTLLIKDN